MENQDRLGKQHLLGIGLSVALVLVPTLGQAQDLTIRWVDTYGLFKVGSEALGKKVQSAFEKVGVRITWKEDPMLTSTPDQREVVVHLRPSEPGEVGFSPYLMGVVFGSLNEARHIWIFFPTIVRAVDPTKRLSPVGRANRPSPSFETRELQRLRKLAWLQQERVARALSAVVVHEVVHAIAPSTGAHASEGVMSRKLLEFLLVSPEHPLDEESAEALRRELVRLAEPASGEPK